MPPAKKPAAKKPAAKKPAAKAAPRSLEQQVQAALASLEQMSTARDLANLARFGITASNALGVSMANVQRLAKRLGKSHELAAALWATNCYEARLLTCFVDEPARVTPAQMDRFCRELDNWAICDTLCFHLFDRTPHAWAKVAEWSEKKGEMERRAAFALLASLAGHDKAVGDEPFVESLRLIERAAADDRNFVKKAVSWALRRIGGRSAALNVAAVALARRLAAAPEPAPRWLGKTALKDLTRPVTLRRFGA